MKRMVLTLVGLSLASAGMASAQQQTQAQLEAQLAELRRQVQLLQQQLRERDNVMTPRAAPKAFGYSTGPGASGGRIYLSDTKPKLGVTVDMVRHAATDSIGASLEDVTSGGPAAEAGLKAGDVITKYNGEVLAGRYPAADDDQSEPGAKLIDLASHLRQGDTVKLEYRRGRDTKTASVVARRLTDSGSTSYSWNGTGEAPFVFRTMPPMLGDPGEFLKTFMLNSSDLWLDMETVAVNAELGEYFGTTKGLLITRAPRDSSLSLKTGDVILAIDGRDVGSAAQMYRVLRSYDVGETVKLDVMRQKRRITVTSKIPDRSESRGGARARRTPGDERRGFEG